MMLRKLLNRTVVAAATAEGEIGRREQRAVLSVAAEVRGLARSVVAELPAAGAADGAREERVELRPGLPLSVVRYQRASRPGACGCRWARPRQVRLERQSGVRLVEVAAGARAGEQERRRVERGVPVRPDRCVGQAVEPGVGLGTALDAVPAAPPRPGSRSRRRRRSAAGSRRCPRCCLPGTRSGCRRCPPRTASPGPFAPLQNWKCPISSENADVVGVRRPDHPGLLGRRAVHRVEGVRDRVAARAGRVVLDLGEAVGRACRHRAGLVVGQVVDRACTPSAVSWMLTLQPVAGVHEQVLARVRRERGQRGVAAGSPAPARRRSW